MTKLLNDSKISINCIENVLEVESTIILIECSLYATEM